MCFSLSFVDPLLSGKSRGTTGAIVKKPAEKVVYCCTQIRRPHTDPPFLLSVFVSFSLSPTLSLDQQPKTSPMPSTLGRCVAVHVVFGSAGGPSVHPDIYFLGLAKLRSNPSGKLIDLCYS